VLKVAAKGARFEFPAQAKQDFPALLVIRNRVLGLIFMGLASWLSTHSIAEAKKPP
jgi:hypothetical protein